MRDRAFFARVEESGTAPARAVPGAETLERDGVRISLTTKTLLGFRARSGDWLFAGEAVAPVDAADLAAACGDGLDLDRLPGSVLSLLAVDFARRRVFLAAGIGAGRGLFWTQQDGGLTVAAHPAALRRAGVRLAWDEATLPEFCAYRIAVPPRTLLRGVRRTVAGETLAWTLPLGGAPARSTWTPPAPVDPAGAVERVEARLRGFLEATADGPRATLLSGGLDSSLLAALERARDPASTAVATSFRWADPYEREEHYAETAARALGVPLTFLPGDSRAFLAGVVDAIDAAGEPVEHLQSVLLHLAFRRFAAAGGSTLLCGLLADALFGNEVHARLHRHRRLLALARLPGAAAALDGLPSARARFLADAARGEPLLLGTRRFVEPALVRAFLGCDDDAIAGGLRRLLAPYRDRPLLDQVSLAVLRTASALAPWGRLAEAAGVRLLFPFADPRLVRDVLALPWAVKLREPKHLVCALLRRHGFPAAYLRRPKLGFGFPYRHWAPPGALLQPLVDLAARDHAPGALASLQRLDGTRPMLLWNLVNLHVWRRLVVDGVAAADLKAELQEAACR